MKSIRTTVRTLVTAAASLVILMGGWFLYAQNSNSPKSTPQYTGDVGTPHSYRPLSDEYLVWPLPAGDEEYAPIDGKRLFQYASEVVAIREKYRDQGHQFWGTITGTTSDVETQQWVLNKFKQYGLDVRIVEHNLPPQWLPNSWEMSATYNGKTLQFPSTFPVNNIPSTPSSGLDVEAVYVGTGSEVEFADRDVRGKAVFIYNNARNHANYSALSEGSALRAEQKGAAAVFLIYAVPGNIKSFLYRMWPQGAHVPTFSIGLADGLAFRDLISQPSNGTPPHVRVRIDAPMVPNLKTTTIFGTLPGMTDETVYISAHRDAIFDGATDNASGLAAMMGLAEYFSKIPGRTPAADSLVFVSPTGHHNDCEPDNKVPCSISIDWMAQHHDELFSRTALMINLEHLTTAQTYMFMGPVRISDAPQEALFWWVCVEAWQSSRPGL